MGYDGTLIIKRLVCHMVRKNVIILFYPIYNNSAIKTVVFRTSMSVIVTPKKNCTFLAMGGKTSLLPLVCVFTDLHGRTLLFFCSPNWPQPTFLCFHIFHSIINENIFIEFYIVYKRVRPFF